MVDKKPLPLLQLSALLLLLLSCLLLPLSAVPSTRSLASRNQEATVLEEAEQMMISREGRMVEELFAKMDIESNDYPGSGANSRHDPRTPGRA